MWLRLRQIALVAAELAPIEAELKERLVRWVLQVVAREAAKNRFGSTGVPSPCILGANTV